MKRNNWFTIKKLTPHIYGIAEFGHFQEVISYLIVGEKKALLFDTGMGIGDIKKEVRMITKNPIIVVNSHCHFDHVGGNADFDSIYLFDNKFSKHVSENGISHAGIVPHMPKNGFYIKPPLSFDERKFHTRRFAYKQLIKDSGIICIDPFSFRVIHTPGHSPDGICLYELKNHYLFCGDLLYEGPIYLHLKESKMKDYKRSIKKLKPLPIRKIYCGHNTYFINPDIILRMLKKLKNLKRNMEILIIGKVRVIT